MPPGRCRRRARAGRPLLPPACGCARRCAHCRRALASSRRGRPTSRRRARPWARGLVASGWRSRLQWRRWRRQRAAHWDRASLRAPCTGVPDLGLAAHAARRRSYRPRMHDCGNRQSGRGGKLDRHVLLHGGHMGWRHNGHNLVGRWHDRQIVRVGWRQILVHGCWNFVKKQSVIVCFNDNPTPPSLAGLLWAVSSVPRSQPPRAGTHARGHQPRSTSRYGLCAMPLHWCPYARCVASRCVVALPRPLPTPPQLPASVSAAPLLPPRSQPLRRTPAAERYRRIRSAADAARAGARALRASRAARSLALGLGHQPLDHAPAALLPALARTLALALEAHVEYAAARGASRASARSAAATIRLTTRPKARWPRACVLASLALCLAAAAAARCSERSSSSAYIPPCGICAANEADDGWSRRQSSGTSEGCRWQEVAGWSRGAAARCLRRRTREVCRVRLGCPLEAGPTCGAAAGRYSSEISQFPLEVSMDVVVRGGSRERAGWSCTWRAH